MPESVLVDTDNARVSFGSGKVWCDDDADDDDDDDDGDWGS